MTDMGMGYEGFAGDPFHEGATQPMDSLKGGMNGPHTQTPAESSAMTNPRSAAPNNIGQTWNSSSLAPTPAPTGDNDGARVH